MQSILENELIKKLLSLNLPRDDYSIFGSGPMSAHGIKELGHDIDIIARGDAWRCACSIEPPVTSIMGNGLVVNLFNKEIEVFDSWAPGDWNIDALIDGSELIEGIRFVSLHDVVKWKKLMKREKDFEHIRLIEDYLRMVK